MKRLAFVMAGAFAVSALAWTTFGGVDAASGQTPPAVLIKRAHDGAHLVSGPPKTIFILALGSDSGAPRHRRGGTDIKGRADSIHIIALNPQQKAGSIVGIPRDICVNLRGSNTKVNAAMYLGGPSLMVDAVEKISGVTFDYYMVTNFDAFETMINELGGVPVTVPHAMNDRFSGANLRKGRQTLNGRQALALARNRHDTPRGDFSRAESQGLIMLGALAKARSDTASNPGRFLNYLRILFKYTKTDFKLDEALRLGLFAAQVSPDSVRNVVIDASFNAPCPGSSLAVTESARATFRDQRDDGMLNSSS
jgi:polyisoprenyl-teichoic acid--peptidoglycan teichoic acid transferase